MARKKKSLEVSTFNIPATLVRDETVTFDNGVLNGVATKSENGYRVISRLDENHIKIIFK